METKKIKSPWPYAIVLTFILLAGFDAYIISRAFQTKPGTVTDAPYEDGLKYEEIIDLKRNAAADGLKLQVATNGQLLNLSVNGVPSGSYSMKVRLIKPDKPALDRFLELNSSDGIFVSETQLASGLWLIKADLKDLNSGKKYFFELKEMVG